ncbi:MAG: MotA/TolQ/ExbB proton channel family protein [Chitinivibrionales bacterium]|nr:MotA/TolQ/ExbB proton channel family protein [Chitinivibrionales bacterium]
MQFLKFIVAGFQSAGAVMQWAILLCLFAGLALVLERVWFLFFKCGMGSSSFMSGIGKYLKAGDYAKAIQYASSINTPLAKGVTAILQNRGKGAKAIQKKVDEVFLSEAPKVQRNLGLLAVVANVATLCGLTGTIYGLMQAFDAIANVPAAQRAAALANGISFAMSTTLFGLTTAVPLIFLHGILSRKSQKIVEEMDEKTVKMINLVEE